MVAFSELVRPTNVGNLIAPRTGRNGFQGSHLIGSAFWNSDELRWLNDLGFGIGRDASSNGGLSPETGRGGYVLGVAVHNGRQVDAFNLGVRRVEYVGGMSAWGVAA